MAPKSQFTRTTRRRLHAAGTTRVPIDPTALDEHVAALVRLLDHHTAADDGDPAIVRVLAAGLTDTGIEVGLRAIGDLDDNVVDALAGFTAPPDWLAVGVLTGGRARDFGQPRDDEGPPVRVRVSHLVTRSGASASVLRFAGCDPIVLTAAESGPLTGRVDDVCRRALGLPTAPPAAAIELGTIAWLVAVVDAEPPPATWGEVVGCHPAVRVVADEGIDLAGATPHLIALGRRFAQVLDWPVLRVASGVQRCPWSDVPPAIARWLDDGAFSRWVLAEYPPLTAIADAACARLQPVLARRVRAALREWGLPESGWLRQ